MTRKRFVWSVRGRDIPLGERTLLMGILNVTPDSFSDGGKYSDPHAALDRALELEAEGADIIDIGAESTRPGSSRIVAGEELRRLIPVLKRIAGRLSIPISVDTYKPEVAEVALGHGVDIINDPSGLTWQPELAKTVVQHDAGLVLNHTRGTPDVWGRQAPLHDVAGTIRTELEASVNRARHAGVQKQRIVVDPGLGFGKRQEQNAEILARLHEFEPLLLPLLVGPSRKSFLGNQSVRETEFATAAAVTLCIAGGAHIVRVHDVTAMRAAAQLADAVAAASAHTVELNRPTGKWPPVKSQADERGPDLDDESRRRPILPPAKPVPVSDQNASEPAVPTRPPAWQDRPPRRPPRPGWDRSGPPPRRGPGGGGGRPPRRGQ